MGGRFERHRGGIRSLGRLIADHPGEIRHLLLSHGLRWRDRGRAWDWADLLVLVEFAPHDSPLVRAIDPNERWARSDHMFADLYDLIGLVVRVLSRDRIKPKPYPRPGDRSVQRFGKPMSMSEALKWREMRRRGEGVVTGGEADAVR